MSDKPKRQSGDVSREIPSPPSGGGASPAGQPADPKRPREIGGPKGPEPTRYGDWEFNGRCTDF